MGRCDSAREDASHQKPNVNKAAHLQSLRVRDDVRQDPTVGASSEKKRPEAEPVSIDTDVVV